VPKTQVSGGSVEKVDSPTLKGTSLQKTIPIQKEVYLLYPLYPSLT
jgi:hypothetical protein